MWSVRLDIDLKGHFVVVDEAPLWVRHILQWNSSRQTAINLSFLHLTLEHEGPYQPKNDYTYQNRTLWWTQILLLLGLSSLFQKERLKKPHHWFWTIFIPKYTRKRVGMISECKHVDSTTIAYYKVLFLSAVQTGFVSFSPHFYRRWKQNKGELGRSEMCCSLNNPDSKRQTAVSAFFYFIPVHPLSQTKYDTG